MSRHITHEPCNDQQNNTPEASVVDSGSASISSNIIRRVTCGDINVVQNLIERCLQLYMNRNEVVNTLLCRARIEPGFTTLILQRMEEQNADFFEAYYIRLKLKQQIRLFNYLLENQYQLMKHSARQTVPMPPMQSGIHHMPSNNPPPGYPILQQPPIPSMGQRPNYLAGSMPSCHAVHGIPTPGNFHATQINAGENMVMDRSAVDTVAVIPPCAIKLENPLFPISMASGGQFPFTTSEISGLIMDASGLYATYKSHMTNADELILGPDGRTQIPQNFSLSDIIEWSNLQDLGTVENYSGFPILPFDEDVLFDSAEQKDIVEDFSVDAVPSAGSHSKEGKP